MVISTPWLKPRQLLIIFEFGALQMNDFFYFCLVFHDQGRIPRYECYRLWVRLLRNRRTPYKKYDHFDSEENLKDNIRSVAKGEIINADKIHRPTLLLLHAKIFSSLLFVTLISHFSEKTNHSSYLSYKSV